MLLEMIPIKEVRLSQLQLHEGDEKMNSVTECLQEQIYKPNHLPAQPGCQCLKKGDRGEESLWDS